MKGFMNDLTRIPGIVSDLGLGIAAAQREMDINFVERLKQIWPLVAQAQKLDAAVASPEAAQAAADAVKSLLEALLPSRYQFTETTLDFSADLSESSDTVIKGGLGLSFKAVTVNASYARAFGYDYRAAARITAVIHAIPSSPALASSFLARAKEIRDAGPRLPGRHESDERLHQATDDLVRLVTGRSDELRIRTLSLPEAQEGVEYAKLTLEGAGGQPGAAYSWEAKGLPDGLELKGAEVTGKPVSAGTHRVTITLKGKDKSGADASVSAAYDLVVQPAAPGA